MNILSALLPQSSQIQMPLTISIAIGISVLPLVLISHMPIVSYLCLSPLCIGLPLEPSNKLYILSFSKLQWFSTVTVKSKLLTKTPHVSLLTLPHNLHEGSFSSHAGFYSVVHIFFFCPKTFAISSALKAMLQDLSWLSFLPSLLLDLKCCLHREFILTT